MSNARFVLFTAIASVALAYPVAAGTLFVTTGGTFSSTTPATAWSAPGDVWTLSFNVSSTPVVDSYRSGQFFSFLPDNAVYTLNGSSVSGLYSVYFDNATPSLGSLGGGFFLCFGDATCDGGDYLSAGAQYYTGPESAPTINTVTGSVYTDGSFAAGGQGFFEDNPNGTITISAVPEPATLLLAFAGSALLVLKRKRGGAAQRQRQSAHRA